MGYQEDCEAYALFGNPQQDHWDHEEAARFDRFDGWGDPDPCFEIEDEPTPEDHWFGELLAEEQEENHLHLKWEWVFMPEAPF